MTEDMIGLRCALLHRPDHHVSIPIRFFLLSAVQYFQKQVRFIITFFLFGFPLFAIAQIVDTTLLPQAEVKESRLRSDFAGTRVEKWNTNELSAHATLADLLQQESGIFIKSYGLGSSATVATRGGSAGHTAVLWNGLPIQSPMLGLLDFSLMPTAFIDNAEIQYGGNSAAWGSGAIGGVISLDNQVEKEKFSLEIQTSAGSFGQFDLGLKSQYQIGKWTGKTRIFQKQADNDFTYQIRKDLPVITQTNAAFNQRGLLQEFYWFPKSNQELSIRFWGQQTDRELPPTAVQTRSLASQKDESLRGSIHWKSVDNKMVWQVRSGLFRENIHYKDPERLTDALSYFWNALGEVEGEYFINKNQQLLIGLSHAWTFADIENYSTPPQQNRTALFASFKQKIKNWNLQINGRGEIVDGKFIPFIPSLGFNGKVSDLLIIQGKISRNYRLPTFNDLYWNPGGNIDLLPEIGWGQEIGITVGQESFYSATFFNRKINNWVYWSPTDQGFWSPQNLSEVWSRGLEQRFKWQFIFEKSKLNLSGGYDFILSTNQVAISKPSIKEGEQLWYAPQHSAFGKLDLDFKNFQINYNHQLTGPVRTPNFTILKKYHIGNLSASYVFKRKQWESQLIFNVKNIWDTNYSVIEYRPMPGRNYQTQLIFKI